MQAEGYPNQAYDGSRNEYEQYPVYNEQAGYPQTAGYPQAGYPQTAGYPQAGYPQTGYPQAGYPPPSYEGSSHQGAGTVQPMMYREGQGLTPVDTAPPRAEAGDTDNWAGTSFSDKKIRSKFIQKVYLILSVQLLVTAAIICWFIFHEPTKQFVKQHWYLYYISYALFIVLFIVLYCCHGVRRKTPGNYICLFLFTLALSYMAASMSIQATTEAVLLCMGITAFVCIGITFFVMQNKIDFTSGKCCAVLIVLVLVLVGTVIATIIVWATLGYKDQWWLSPLIGGIAALIMSLVLAIDTHMIMGGGKHELSPEEYIVAALDLYIDIVYLFLIILCIMGGSGGGD